MIKHWNKWKEVVGCPSLEILKNRPDTALNNFPSKPVRVRGVDYESDFFFPEVPSHLSDSVVRPGKNHKMVRQDSLQASSC